MEKKDLITTCEFENEIVPYLYNELAAEARDKFESHLADCMTCIDEFAAVSHSRYSVFEWRREEFDHLPTPKIVIPELAKAAASATSESGWFAGLAAALSFARSPLTAAAVLLVCLGVGFVAITLLGSADNQIAANLVETPKIPNSETAPKGIGPDRGTTNDSGNVVSEPDQPDMPRRRPTAEYRSVPTNVKIKPAYRRNNVMPQMAKKPALNDFKEETDESLRLSDLFDEVGG